MKNVITPLALLFVLAGCTGQGPGTEKEAEGQAPVPVEVVPATSGDISQHILSTGTADATVVVALYPKLTGQIVDLNMEDGQRVRKGELLALIDPRELQLLFREAETTAEELQANFTRLQEMHKNRMTSEESFQAAKFAHEKAVIARDLAELRLENTRITAPMSGLVINVSINLGERVTPSQSIAGLVDTTTMAVSVYLPEKDRPRIVPDMKAEVLSESYPGVIFPGKVKGVSFATNPTNGTFEVQVKYVDPERKLRPGTFVQVRLLEETHTSAVLIPRSAVVEREGYEAVFVIRPREEAASTAEGSTPMPEGNSVSSGMATAATSEQESPAAKKEAPVFQVEQVFFEVGFENEMYIEALSGVEAGDLLVNVGQQSLKPGSLVTILESPKGPGSR